MAKKIATLVFDRKKELEKKGTGKVEIYISLGQGAKKYITLKRCTTSEWKRFEKSAEGANEIRIYTEVVEAMERDGDPMSVEALDLRLGIKTKKAKTKKVASPTGFVDFMEEMIKKEDMSEGTRKHKNVTLRAVKAFGKLNSFASLTPQNIVAFDDTLHDGARTTVSVNNYHKHLRLYCRMAYERGYIVKSPYDSDLCHFKKGKSKERRPLIEEEMVRVRNLDRLTNYEEHARDIFVFCAYTGLAYADCQAFNFETMTDNINGTFYIDGSRVKTGSNFFTPILPPAMEVLVKYDFHIPQMSNQKLNQYLHLIEARLKLNKPMTSHVARHSFATLCLSYDIPLENVSRMLGHTSTKTTRIYAKILKTTIERHTNNLLSSIK